MEGVEEADQTHTAVVNYDTGGGAKAVEVMEAEKGTPRLLVRSPEP